MGLVDTVNIHSPIAVSYGNNSYIVDSGTEGEQTGSTEQTSNMLRIKGITMHKLFTAKLAQEIASATVLAGFVSTMTVWMMVLGG